MTSAATARFGLKGMRALAASLALLVPHGASAADEVLGAQRINNRANSAIFPVAPGQARVSELRVRSGSLSVRIQSIEIEYSDGTFERMQVGNALAPGAQSPPMPVDPRRPIARVRVATTPGLRPGETSLQLLGRVARP